MEKEEENFYSEDVTRLDCNFLDTYSWYKGESEELKKWFEFGFNKTIFVSEEEKITVYYHSAECDEWWDILKERLTEDLFNEICDDFFSSVEQLDKVSTNQEIFDLMVKCWPAWIIFDEVSKYPEDLVKGQMMDRLMRLRRSTENFSYDLSKKIRHEGWFRNYILTNGEIIRKPFQDFTKENRIVIK